jgi:hypothetical protein
MFPRLEIGIDCPDPDALAPFWCVALGYRRGAGDGYPYVDLVAPAPGLPVVFLQRVPEPKRGKNRVHLDLYVADPAAVIADLEERGATRVGPWVGAAFDGFQVMADPAGNEFCVCAET